MTSAPGGASDATRSTVRRALPPSSPYADDDGSPDPALAPVLAGYRTGESSLADVVAALAATRVLVPVLPTSAPGAAVPALTSPDGRRALPVFTSVAAMAAWQPDARPIPASVPHAALSAVGQDWSLLVLDPGGPITVVIPRPAVWAIAQGKDWRPAVVAGAVDADVADAIVSAVARFAHVGSVAAEPGRTAEVAVVLRLDPGLDRAGLARLLADVNAALAASALVAERVDSLELQVGRAS